MNFLLIIGHNQFSIAQLGVLREQHTDIYKATCDTTWVEGLLRYLTCKCYVHRVETSSGEGDTDILLKVFFFFKPHYEDIANPFYEGMEILQTTQ